MEMLFENLNFMHWLVLGLSLIILELFLWTVFLLWIGASAITVSIFFYLMPDTSWPIQLLIFVHTLFNYNQSCKTLLPR